MNTCILNSATGNKLIVNGGQKKIRHLFNALYINISQIFRLHYERRNFKQKTAKTVSLLTFSPGSCDPNAESASTIISLALTQKGKHY